jgi:hypothetical protein
MREGENSCIAETPGGARQQADQQVTLAYAWLAQSTLTPILVAHATNVPHLLCKLRVLNQAGLGCHMLAQSPFTPILVAHATNVPHLLCKLRVLNQAVMGILQHCVELFNPWSRISRVHRVNSHVRHRELAQVPKCYTQNCRQFRCLQATCDMYESISVSGRGTCMLTTALYICARYICRVLLM